MIRVKLKSGQRDKYSSLKQPENVDLGNTKEGDWYVVLCYHKATLWPFLGASLIPKGKYSGWQNTCSSSSSSESWELFGGLENLTVSWEYGLGNRLRELRIVLGTRKFDSFLRKWTWQQNMRVEFVAKCRAYYLINTNKVENGSNVLL